MVVLNRCESLDGVARPDVGPRSGEIGDEALQAGQIPSKDVANRARASRRTRARVVLRAERSGSMPVRTATAAASAAESVVALTMEPQDRSEYDHDVAEAAGEQLHRALPSPPAARMPWRNWMSLPSLRTRAEAQMPRVDHDPAKEATRAARDGAREYRRTPSGKCPPSAATPPR